VDEAESITGASSVYSSSHLSFRRDLIDPLADTDQFEVSTPAGRFRMTRADFYATFPEVVSSASYRDLGHYHYPMIPYKAFRFLVRETKSVLPDQQPGGEA
jgi:hypothetical protein